MEFRKGAVYMDLDFKQYLQYGKHGLQAWKGIKKMLRWKKRFPFGKKRKKQRAKSSFVLMKKEVKPKVIKIHHTKLLGQILWAVKNRYF